MKKLLILLLVLLYPSSLYAVCPVVTEGGEEHHLCDRTYDGDVLFNGSVSIPGGLTDPSMVKQTTADMNLYVRTTGNDSNDCLSAGAACLTIQEAVDRVPKFVYHDVLIDVGESSFASAIVQNFNVGAGKSLTVQGTLGNPTLGGGTTSGTADGGTTTQCIDSGQAWVVNELRGQFVLVNGEYRVVYENDGTTIDFVGAFSGTCNGEAYEIFEPKSILSTGDVGIFMKNNNCSDVDEGITVRNFKSTVVWYGVGVYNTNRVTIERIQAIGTKYGVFLADLGTVSVTINDVFLSGNTITGIWLLRVHRTRNIERVFAYNGLVGITCQGGEYSNFNSGIFVTDNSSHGIKVEKIIFFDLDAGLIDNNGGYGIYIDENSSGNKVVRSHVNLTGDITISNNTLGGIIALNNSIVSLTNVDGTGNGAYGLELETGSSATITSATGITGASGDATINSGSTVLVWASDFNDNGDIVVNIDNGCRIERKD